MTKWRKWIMRGFKTSFLLLWLDLVIAVIGLINSVYFGNEALDTFLWSMFVPILICAVPVIIATITAATIDIRRSMR